MTRAGEKMLTTTLGATCAALFLLALALQLGIGRGYHWTGSDAAADTIAAGKINRESFEMPPRASFDAIDQRPLFNDDRRPGKDEPADAAGDTPPPSPLNISLTGVLLAARPELRMAMLRENGKVQTIALKEGMPLPGDQGGWTLTEVKNRSAIFKSTSGEEVEVELAIVNTGQNAGRAGPGAGKPARVGQAGPVPAPPPAAPADELQRRIEERRRQMREAAERMKAERQNEQQPEQQQQ